MLWASDAFGDFVFPFLVLFVVDGFDAFRTVTSDVEDELLIDYNLQDTELEGKLINHIIPGNTTTTTAMFGIFLIMLLPLVLQTLS